jgi:hypothetical protein
MCATVLHIQEQPHLELKTWPRFNPVSSNFSMDRFIKFNSTGACIIKLITDIINSVVYKASVFVGASKK